MILDIGCMTKPLLQVKGTYKYADTQIDKKELMILNIILPFASIILGLVYSKWLYKANNGFFRKNVDLFSSSKDLQGWFVALTLIIAGILFLFKGILNHMS